MKATVTITFGEVCENHVGNQQIGDMAEEGFNLEDLERAKEYFEERGCECELKHLNVGLSEDIKAKDAFFLVIRNGVNALSNADRLGKLLEALKWDTKAKMRGTVKNKRARHNLCFGPESQEPHYESGKGTIVAFKDVPLLEAARDKLPDILGEKANELFAEGNLYYDISQCGIGFHGDGERKKVAKIWSKEYKSEIKPEDINCDGCLAEEEGRVFNYCKVCEIRKCGQEKGIKNCAYCDDYACDKLNDFFKMAPAAKTVLEEIKKNL